jgi:hypothetical protein
VYALAETAVATKENELVRLHSPWFLKVRFFAGLLLLIGGALLSSYKLLKQSPPLSSRPAADEVSAYEARFARVRQVLPQHGVVCYVPDFNSSEAAKKDFFLARYALAPLVVRTVPDCDPLIADFPSGLPPSFLDHRYAVLKDFGQGVLLLKRNSR